MKWFQKTSIKRKQTLIILLTSSAVLALACAGFATYEVLTFRRTLLEHISSLAEIIGRNSAAALDFNDPRAAQETLAALTADSDILGAGVYQKGKLFAAYDRFGDGMAFRPPDSPASGHQFHWRTLSLFRPVLSKGEEIGTVYLECDLRPLYSRLKQYGLIVLLVFSVSAFVGWGLSAGLQRLISGPILQLVQTTRQVAQDKNYSARAIRQSEDELGALVDSFNEMLEQIQHRDGELQKAKDELEVRVKERTAELDEAITALQQENRERQEAQVALRSQEERTRLIIDQASDAVITTDIDLKIIGWNRQAEMTFGWPKGEILGRNLLETVVPERRRALRLAEVTRLRETGEWSESNRLFESTAIIKNGRELPVELTMTPIRLGGSYIFTVFVRDISQRKQSEAELEKVHKQLLEASRQAGMAEVATSVLHNVGNVLNSVNVSASLLTDKIRHSRISTLGKAAKLMREHPADLVLFLSEDKNGRQLPGLILAVVEHLTHEQTGLLEELAGLSKNIDHIKDIVAMQQNYAKISGVSENASPVDLVEDALAMNQGAFSRHDVQIVREYLPVPSIVVEKHKALQILINLVRNAKYALDDGGKREKLLRVCIRPGNGKAVAISVIDNGVGIPAENLTRIFSYGFTTRKGGHGFGLHSGALAAKEMGGSLTVQSDGPGKGAQFTLELPIEYSRSAL